MKRWIIVMAAVFLVSTAQAQEAAKPRKPSPEEVKQAMEEKMSTIVPMFGRMAEVTIEAQLKAAEKPDTAQRLAAFKKNLYDALIAQGFSSAQALTITVATHPPSPSMPGQ